jgi:hypothetical protein
MSMSPNCQLIVRLATTRHRARYSREHRRHQFRKTLLRPTPLLECAGGQIRPHDGILIFAQVSPALPESPRM